MSLLEVRHALMARATSTSPGAAIPDASTWYENKRKWNGSTEVSPPTNALWYRIMWVPGSRPKMDGIGAGAMVRHTGFMQINVCEPRDVGDVPVSTEAQRIQDCFKAGLNLSYNGQGVTVVSTGRAGGMFDATGAYVIAVTIYWQADVLN